MPLLMKKLILILTCIAFSSFAFSQETYKINNETLELKTEVAGTFNLLWNTFDGQFRYFIKNKDEQVTELTNTKGSNNKYNNAYQETLTAITGMDASKTKLTLYSLKQFINTVNAKADENYTFDDAKAKLKLRLGLYGGLSNNPFISNPSNEITPFFGTELEVVSDGNTSNHAGFLNLRFGTESDSLKYSSTQLALGYRYRFINKPTFNIYGQTKFATLTFSNATITIPDPSDSSNTITTENSETSFDANLIFGLGADIKLGKGYLTFVYDSLFGIFIDNQDNFPVDFAVGYKFNL